MNQPTLIYFPTRGRAELIRVVLAAAGVDYHEHPVKKGAPPENGRPTDFQQLKDSGELPFQAVPVWIEPDGFHLAQSGAIARYLAAGHGLYGAGPREAALCEQMLGAYDDVRGEVRKLAALTSPEARAALVEELSTHFLPRWMGYLDRLVGQREGQPYLVGDALSIADLSLWYLLEQMVDNGYGATFAPRQPLAAWYARMSDHPRIKVWVKSPRRWPFVPLPR
jgi:glutathione S-transferase